MSCSQFPVVDQVLRLALKVPLLCLVDKTRPFTGSLWPSGARLELGQIWTIADQIRRTLIPERYSSHLRLGGILAHFETSAQTET